MEIGVVSVKRKIPAVPEQKNICDWHKWSLNHRNFLSEEEIAEVLKVADELAKWSADVYAYAQDEAITHGRVWNGFKLVEGRSNRKYVNEEEVADAAKAAGYEDIYKKSLIGITEMEKLMGKKDFQKILGSLVYKRRAKSPWYRNLIRAHQFKQKPLRRILRRMNK